MFKTAQQWVHRIDWINLSFLTSAHLLAVGGTWLLWTTDMIVWPTVVLAVVMAVLTGLSITVGYHRLFAHKSFEAHWFIKALLLCFGAAAFQNSARKWGSDHRRHHKYVDTEKDPYNIKEGFLFAHIGWVLLKYDEKKVSYDDVPDLINDPLVRFQENHYVKLAIGFGFLLPTLVASLWGDPLGGFFLAGWLRLILNEHFTFSINSFSHLYGKQPYSDADSSRDNWFFALFSYGEGYHNFHHKFPFDYRNGVRTHQWDPSKWLIWALSRFGMTQNLKQTPRTAILRARIKMDEKRLLQQVDRLGVPDHHRVRELIVHAREQFETAHARFLSLKEEYKRLKSEQWAHMNNRIDHLRSEIKKARASAKDALRAWVELCSGYGVKSFLYAV